MPTTLVDWTRLYRGCGLRRTEEYHRVALIRMCTGFSTQLPGSLILQALRCQPLCRRGGHDAAIAGVCCRRRRVRGSTYSLDIVALPRPAAFLGAALGRGPDFCGSYVSHACWRSRFPQGWIPACDGGSSSGLADLVRAPSLTRKQVLVIRAQSACSGLQLLCAPRR